MTFVKFGLQVLVVAITLVGLTADSVAQQQWNSFQNGGQLQQDDWQLPTEWSPEQGIAWRLPLAGYGQSTPVLHQQTLYVTSVTGKNKDTLNVQAISTVDGSSKWTFNHPNSSPEANTVMVSRAAPTPVSDSQGVIAFFEGGNLIALDHSGELRWKRDLREEFGDLKARHGLAASLEQDQDHIFLWAERMENPYVMAISKSDGKTVWKKDGVGSTSWGSPRLVPVGESQHLVLSAVGKIVGLEPSTGEILWSFDRVAGNSSATPVPVGNGRFLIGASGGRQGGPSSPSCGVIEIKEADSGFSASWLWVAENATCSFGSPFAFQNRCYFVNRSGIVQCFEVETGKLLFKKRLPAGPIWATPIASQDLIYFFGKSGVTSVVKPGDQLDLVAENQLWEPEAPKAGAGQAQDPASRMGGAVLYAATGSGNYLFVRRGDVLYALKKSDGQ